MSDVNFEKTIIIEDEELGVFSSYDISSEDLDILSSDLLGFGTKSIEL